MADRRAELRDLLGARQPLGLASRAESPGRDERRDGYVECTVGRLADVERCFHDGGQVGGNLVPLRGSARVEARDFRIDAVTGHRSVDLREDLIDRRAQASAIDRCGRSGDFDGVGRAHCRARQHQLGR